MAKGHARDACPPRANRVRFRFPPRPIVVPVNTSSSPSASEAAPESSATAGPVVHADLLTDLLRDVSRTFYKTLRILPVPIRRPVSLAYLLARATDTIADTELVPVSGRLAALDHLRGRILGQTAAPLDFTAFTSAAAGAAPSGGTEAERVLLARIEEALVVLASLDAADQALIREVLTTITSGQELDLRRFGTATVAQMVALQNDAELDDYAYRVAGCVGEFWTRICRRRLFPELRLDDARLLANGVRFGKGLQLVNILRDLPRDLRQGRCYIPADGLAHHGLSPAALLDATAIGRFRDLYDAHLAIARQHLAAGWDYTNMLPRRQVRVRLACAWPILIGMRTLARLRTGNVLDAGRRIKVSRAEVRRLILRTVVCYPRAGAWEKLFDRARL